MKKDRISLFILAFEIVAIVAMHAAKPNSSEIVKKTANELHPAPFYSPAGIPSENMVMYIPGYSY